MWQKKVKEITKEKEKSTLEELCGNDVKLYDCLKYYLYINPRAAVSEKDLKILTEEAEKSGNIRPALDKAILEGAQNPGDREFYTEVIRSLSTKSVEVIEQEKLSTEKTGNPEQAANLGRKIDSHRFFSERVEDILSVATKFYAEIFVKQEETVRKEVRASSKTKAEEDDLRTRELEKDKREIRKQERHGMGREERRQAEIQDKRDELAYEQNTAAREQRKREAESEETKISEQEKAGQEARRRDRMGD